jgi:hypothetical protein
MDFDGLQEHREQRFFQAWDGYVAAEHVSASEAAICRLIDKVMAIGPALDEGTARRSVRKSVLGFNKLNDGWICTIEREDICEELDHIIEFCGFSSDDEDWLAGRDW